jgi:predicted ATPase
MIRSITFDGKSGYIGAKYSNEDKPSKPNRNALNYQKRDDKTHCRVFDEEKYKRDMERYESELEFFKKVKGEYKVECSKLLVGRTFEFSPDKVNLIFGPNASGKTTIIRSIASHAFCEDGFSKFLGPFELQTTGIFSTPTKKDYMKGLSQRIVGMARTSSVIDWDGSPIYYHNFENRQNFGSLGDLTGSIIKSTFEEINYVMSKGKMSGGQNMFYQFNKLCNLMSKNITFGDILKPHKRYEKFNKTDAWRVAYETQMEYYSSFPMAFDDKGINTYLFDEVDKSMDILNVFELYSKILPELIDKYKKQIIIISHSPVILRDEIYDSDKYNIVSIDEEYTEKCRELFK